MTVGIIGLGRFGKLIANYMKRYFKVYGYDIKKKNISGVEFCMLEEAASKEIVIVAVPIRNFEKVIKNISTLVKPDALICDVCSVKEKPIKWMKKYLPRDVSILATHPLFGPDSFLKNSGENSIIIYPVRINRNFYKIIKKELKKFGFNIHEMNPIEHDKLMAQTQLLLHLIARIMNPVGKNKENLTTKNYRKIMEIFSVIYKDSHELFSDMVVYNRFARSVLDEFVKKYEYIIKTCK